MGCKNKENEGQKELSPYKKRETAREITFSGTVMDGKPTGR